MEKITNTIIPYFYIIIICCAFNFGSGIIGTYDGKSISGIITETKKNGKVREREVYNPHHLTLNKDSTFHYTFQRDTYYSSISNVKLRSCSGRWDLIEDTLVLNSNYGGDDFFMIKEKTNDSLPENVVQISLKSQDQYYMWGSSSQIWINENRVEKCRVDESIRERCNEIKSIKLNIIPINFEYKFEPKNKESNEFEVVFKTALGNDNYYLDNWKLLIEKNKLTPLSELNGLVNGLEK